MKKNVAQVVAVSDMYADGIRLGGCHARGPKGRRRTLTLPIEDWKATLDFIDTSTVRAEENVREQILRGDFPLFGRRLG